MAKCKSCGYELEYCQDSTRIKGDKQFTHASVCNKQGVFTTIWLCPECNTVHEPIGSDNAWVHTDKYPN